MSYSQLTACERNEFYELRSTTDLSIRMIAEKIGRHEGTLSRALTRNQSSEGIYLPDSANSKGRSERQSKSVFRGVSESWIAEIKQRLKQDHSPEQIAGRLQHEGKASLSHETIYQMLYANHAGLKDYQLYLRQGRGKRRKRGGLTQSGGRFQGESGLNIARSLQLPRLRSVIGKVTR